jgi:alkanesulfonate monooxygenase SsuD/methylene tetrahydromethanopterin reductase-like flavin-dependent oxidoreductase (luciferase family)
VDIDICLDSRLSSAETARLGRLAEQCGIRAVWNTCGIDTRDPFTNLAELARATATLRLGPMAISPYEIHPFRIAMGLLTLNEISGGRAEIALGAGADVLEPAGLVAHRPVAALRDCLRIVRGAVHERPFTYEGELYSLKGYDPTWAVAPPPPVIACAMMPQMLRMATGIADGVMWSDYTPTLIRDTTEQTRRLRAEHGLADRPFVINSFQPLYLAADHATARRQARSTIAWRALWRENITSEFLTREEYALLLDHMPALYAMAMSGGTQTSVDGVPDRILEACVEKLTVTGTFADPAPVVEQLLALRDAGLDRVALGIEHDPEATIRTLGEHVVAAVG